MREEALRAVLLVKAIEESDRTGTLLPLADRAAATRDAARAAGAAAAPELDVEAAALPGKAQRLLAARAALLRRQLGTRHPFVETVLALSTGPGWVGRLLLVAALLLGFSLSALDGTRRIDMLSFPLLGLLLWNLLVYLLIVAGWVRALFGQPRRRPAAGLLARAALRPIGRLVARSAKFNAALAEALGRFLGEWSETARPLLLARMARLFHLSAAAVALGLIAGLYLRGMVLDYRAGWASTFLDAPQVHALLSVLYGPASSTLRIPIPDVSQLAAMRWEGGRGGVGAAPWIHLIAGTALLFIVLPRLLLAALATLQTWRYALRAPLPAALVPYFRSAFSSVEGVVGRGIVALMPYAYEPAPPAFAALRKLLPAALGENLVVDTHATVRYGEEDAFLGHLAERGGAVADVIALLFSLAATPEDENHGAVIAGVRDWLTASRRPAQLLVLVDEGPYAERMAAQAGAASRMAERRHAWQDFAVARGMNACFVDLGQVQAAAPDRAEIDRVRAALWQPAAG
ncbi:MAG TPA: DUF2868 domain-containing protein [Burkholderiales bacterium]|jgi:hypothetical protein